MLCRIPSSANAAADQKQSGLRSSLTTARVKPVVDVPPAEKAGRGSHALQGSSFAEPVDQARSEAGQQDRGGSGNRGGVRIVLDVRAELEIRFVIDVRVVTPVESRRLPRLAFELFPGAAGGVGRRIPPEIHHGRFGLGEGVHDDGVLLAGRHCDVLRQEADAVPALDEPAGDVGRAEHGFAGVPTATSRMSTIIGLLGSSR